MTSRMKCQIEADKNSIRVVSNIVVYVLNYGSLQKNSQPPSK